MTIHLGTKNPRNYRTWKDQSIDRSRWGKGPWDNEPDKIQWTDETTELPCLIKRSHLGTLCGYIGVPKGHPLHEVSYFQKGKGSELLDAVEDASHCGLTYSDKCQRGPESQTVCHVPEPGETDDVWWLGFDCGHLGDYVPAIPPIAFDDVYRDVAYVTHRVTHMALVAMNGVLADTGRSDESTS